MRGSIMAGLMALPALVLGVSTIGGETPCGPQPNLLSNPSWETGFGGWNYLGVTVDREDNPVSDGVYSLSASGSTYFMISQLAGAGALDLSQDYTFSVDVASYLPASASVASVVCTIELWHCVQKNIIYTSTFTILRGKQPAFSNIHGTFRPPNHSEQLNIEVSCGNPQASFYFDNADFSLTLPECPATTLSTVTTAAPSGCRAKPRSTSVPAPAITTD